MRFASPRQVVRTVLYGPEPVGQRGAAVLQGYADQNLNGQGGFPHFGMRGSEALTWSGYAATPQYFQGAAQLGSTPNPPVLPFPALPNAKPPGALPTWIQDWTSLEGIVP